MDQTTTCPNCGTPSQGRYCAGCGQDNRRSRIRLRDWISEATDLCTDINRPLFRTMGQLVLRPGVMVRGYVHGQRARYVSPFRLVVVATALWFMAVQFQLRGQDLSVLPAATRLLVEYIQPLNLSFLPLLAGIQYLIFLGSRTNYAEALCFQMYVFSVVFLWRAAMAATAVHYPVFLLKHLELVELGVLLAYFSWALHGFYRGRAFLVWVRIPVYLAAMIAGSRLATDVLARLISHTTG